MQDIPLPFIFFAVASFSAAVFFAVMHFLSRKDLNRHIAQDQRDSLYNHIDARHREQTDDAAGNQRWVASEFEVFERRISDLENRKTR